MYFGRHSHAHLKAVLLVMFAIQKTQNYVQCWQQVVLLLVKQLSTREP